MLESIRLLILVRHLLFGECLALALSKVGQAEIVEVLTDVQCVTEAVASGRPDIILIDIDLTNDRVLELTKQLRSKWPGMKLIILGMADVEALIIKYIEAGANGYHLEQSPLEELIATIYSAYRGEAVCSPRIAYSVFARVAELSLRRMDDHLVESLSLTPRELEILGFIADGLSNKEIASQLNLSLYTVKNHVHNLMEKLRVHNRLEVVRYALRNGFIDLARKH